MAWGSFTEPKVPKIEQFMTRGLDYDTLLCVEFLNLCHILLRQVSGQWLAPVNNTARIVCPGFSSPLGEVFFLFIVYRTGCFAVM